jgi:predicted ATP-binding protein involved in virulence
MNSSPESIIEPTPPPAYFGSLTIENVKCFKGEQTIDLSDGNGKPALWTVILGDNNTGKTTLLRCMADLEAIKIDKIDSSLKHLPMVLPKHGSKSSFTKKTYSITSSVLLEIDSEHYINNNNDVWRYTSESCALANYGELGNFIIYGYGTNRKMGKASLSDTENQDNTASLFDNNVTLTNAEEWLIQTDYASKNGIASAELRLKKIKDTLTNGLLPDAKNFRFVSKEENSQIRNFVEIETDYGWIKLRELGYGYQVTLAWVVDLAKKLFERYPDSKNPLHEPAIVLIDELDLHLHPEWQRKIIKFLSDQFPRTQFIATTHSPLIVQSAENINLVILEKQEDHVIIKQRPDIKTFKGWTVEEILTELMGMDDKTLSDAYLKSMHQFDEALDEDDYHKAKQAYDELDKILHPRSVQRKLLSIQMSSLVAE